MEREPLHYDQILYNEAIYQLEKNWNRALTDHEKELVKFGYRFGRLKESEQDFVLWTR
jgi:hypothetical protein